MSDIVEINVITDTGFAGCTHEQVVEFDRDEWDAMDDHEKEEACKSVAFEYIEWNWEEVN